LIIESEEDAIKNLDPHPDGELEYIAFEEATDHVKNIFIKQKSISPYILCLNRLEEDIEFSLACYNSNPTPLNAQILKSQKVEYEAFLNEQSHRIDWQKVA
jgi:hypothetical protein